MPSSRWPSRAKRVISCPSDSRRRPRHKLPTGRPPSIGGKGAVYTLTPAEHARRPPNLRLRSTCPHRTSQPHGEVPWEAAVASAANAEGRVWARGMSASQAATRIKVRAVATSRCMSRVITNPMERERRRPPRRVPWAIVPSMPARRAYPFVTVSVCCRARAACRTVSWSRSRMRHARGAVAARVPSARRAQAAHPGFLKAIRTVAWPCRSGRSRHTPLRCPGGPMAYVASQSIPHRAAAPPFAACSGPLWAAMTGPLRSLLGAVRLVRRWSEVPEPASTNGSPGGSWRVARGACMGGRTTTSAGVAGGVVTAVLRVGVSSSQVAVPGPLSPVQSVSRFVPSRASGAEGALSRRGAGGRASALRQHPGGPSGVPEHGCTPPLPPALDGGPLPPPGGRGRRGDGPQHLVAVRAHVLGQRRAGGPLRRQALCRQPPARTLAPRRRDPGVPPRWRGGGQPVPRMAERFADALESLEGVESGQDMRRGGAWAALRFEEPLRATQRSPRLAQEECGLACAQALAALAQD